MKNRRLFAPLLAFLLIAALFAGCASKSYDNAHDAVAKPGSAPEYSYGYGDLVDVKEDASLSTSTSGETPSYQKKIRNLEMNVETEDLDALLSNVENRVNELGGYVEQKEVYRGSAYAERVFRNAYLTLRIPAEQADFFVEKVGEVSNITSTTEDVDDVTLQYVPTDSRITALTTEETRLLELLAKAENMEDLLLIESRLTDVRTELEEYTSQLRIFDNLVNYATIRLRVSEVKEYTPTQEKSFWQRIGSGFMENLKDLGTGLSNFVVFLITSLPYLVPIAVILLLILLAVKAGLKKGKKNKGKKETPQE